MEIKQNALEHMRSKVAAWPKKENGWAASDIQNALKAQDQQLVSIMSINVNHFLIIFCVYSFRNGQHERRTLAKRRTEYIESGNKLWKEEKVKRQDQLNQDYRLEIERREREKMLLAEYAELRKNTRVEDARKFRELLDKQCVSKQCFEL